MVVVWAVVFILFLLSVVSAKPMEIPCSWPFHIRLCIANELRLTHQIRRRTLLRCPSGGSYAPDEINHTLCMVTSLTSFKPYQCTCEMDGGLALVLTICSHYIMLNFIGLEWHTIHANLALETSLFSKSLLNFLATTCMLLVHVYI